MVAPPPRSVAQADAHADGQADDASSEAVDEPPPPVQPPPAVVASSAEEQLAGRILMSSHAMETLTELVTLHPSRVTGSKGHDAAATWAVEAFKKAGIARARVEPFTMAHGWERREAKASVAAPHARTLHATAAGWFPPTTPEGVHAELVHPAELTEAAVKKGAARIKGKLVLLDAANKKKGWATSLAALRDAGAVGLVNALPLPDQAPFAHSAWFASDLVGPLPMVDVGAEDGELLVRWLAEGPVTLDVVSTSPVTGAVQVPNVVAEIRGREHPEEWVMLGAHLDAWDFGEGAQDDGTGVAEVLEAARAIQALGTPPRRSIRFALFGGEEQGALGSRAYADAHAHELDRATLVVVSDSGAGQPRGFLTGRDDLVKGLAPLTRGLAGLGGAALSPTFECGQDDCPFALLGVPAISFECDEAKYPDVHHRAADTLGKVVPAHVVQATAILALTAWAAAELPTRLAPRATHAEIAERLKRAGTYDALVFQRRFTP